MHRMSVTIDEDLLQRAQRALGTHTKRETIVVALEEAARRRAVQVALAAAGTVDLGFTVDDLLRQRDEDQRKLVSP